MRDKEIERAGDRGQGLYDAIQDHCDRHRLSGHEASIGLAMAVGMVIANYPKRVERELLDTFVKSLETSVSQARDGLRMKFN